MRICPPSPPASGKAARAAPCKKENFVFFRALPHRKLRFLPRAAASKTSFSSARCRAKILRFYSVQIPPPLTRIENFVFFRALPREDASILFCANTPAAYTRRGFVFRCRLSRKDFRNCALLAGGTVFGYNEDNREVFRHGNETGYSNLAHENRAFAGRACRKAVCHAAGGIALGKR